MRTIIIGVLIVAAAVLGYVFYSSRETAPVDGNPPPVSNEKIVVDTPKPGDLVGNPVVVSGRARGYWYFEASFPVEIVDANGKRLAMVPMQAIGEWMTEEFVPFSSPVAFATTSAATGTIILHKDNPSGDPERDESVSIPIRFR